MLPLENYRYLPFSMQPGLTEPLKATYSPDVIYIHGVKVDGAYMASFGVSEWLKAAQEEWRKFPPRVPAFDSDKYASDAWIHYRTHQSQPLTESSADQWRWWLRCKLIQWGII